MTSSFVIKQLERARVGNAFLALLAYLAIENATSIAMQLKKSQLANMKPAIAVMDVKLVGMGRFVLENAA